MEFPSLHDGIASSRGVGYEEDLMGCGRIDLAKRALHFRKLLHEVRLGMEPSGGITDEEVGFQALCLGKSIVAESRWISPILTADNLDTKAFTPGLQLLDSRCAEGVGRAEKNSVTA